MDIVADRDIKKSVEETRRDYAKYIGYSRKFNSEKSKDIKLSHYLNIKHFYIVAPKSLMVKPHRYNGWNFYNMFNINRHGYAFIWFPRLDFDEDEYRNRSNVYDTMKLLMFLSELKPKGWIIDFRGNSGGIIEYFLTIVAVMCGTTDHLYGYDNRNNKNSSIIMDKVISATIEDVSLFYVHVPFTMKDKMKNVFILIDNNTASASEISTIFLKRALNATVCGERSHGIISLMQSTTYQGYTFVYPVSKLKFDEKNSDYITPDVDGIPDFLNPDGDFIDESLEGKLIPSHFSQIDQ